MQERRRVRLSFFTMELVNAGYACMGGYLPVCEDVFSGG